jgi:hypothetical protein
MCKVYNQVGSLSVIKSQLEKNGIREFKAVNELLAFQKNFPEIRQQIVSTHTLLLEQERNTLAHEIERLRDSIAEKKKEIGSMLEMEIESLKEQLDRLPANPSSIIGVYIAFFQKIYLKSKVWFSERRMASRISNSVEDELNVLNLAINRHEYLSSEFGKALEDSSLSELQEIDKKKKIIDALYTTIYGAIGEHKVVKELEKLSDDFILVNDFTCLFDPPIYNKQDEDYIRSIQIDHVLIAPSGIFLIETKHWSEKSLMNLELRSPVQQVKRNSYALFKILSDEDANLKPPLQLHHWGSRRIPSRNIIVFTKERPREVFQFVKVLTLNELNGYVKYFEWCFLGEEVVTIAEHLLNLNGRTIPTGR